MSEGFFDFSNKPPTRHATNRCVERDSANATSAPTDLEGKRSVDLSTWRGFAAVTSGTRPLPPGDSVASRNWFGVE